jgi:hypothetical protein
VKLLLLSFFNNFCGVSFNPDAILLSEEFETGKRAGIGEED